jgi:hypothetical protein
MENSKGQNKNMNQESLDQQKSRLSGNESYNSNQQQNVSTNRNPQQRGSGSQQQNESMRESENLQGDSFDQQDVSTSRGGTNDITRNSSQPQTGRTSSGISGKRGVTGSDYDGQVSPE